MFITAHPDDECMFFAPAITNFTTNKSIQVYILCLSTGDYYGAGLQRKVEFGKSVEALGIMKDKASLVNNHHLQDGPKNDWDSRVIREIVYNQVISKQIKSIFTFDKYGVSGHLNHRDLATAIYSMREQLQDTKIFSLKSVNRVRKYLGCLDWFWSNLISKKENTYITSMKGLIQTYHAMYSHRSQLTWFRVLYILFSRYAYMNEYVGIST